MIVRGLVDVESALGCGVSKVLRICNQEGLLNLFWTGCCVFGTGRFADFLKSDIQILFKRVLLLCRGSSR